MRNRPSAAWWVPASLFTGVFLLTALTLSDYGLAWDEPDYFHASDLEVRWLADFARNLVQGRAAESLDDEVIAKAWHWDPYHVAHPPFSRILSGFSHTLLSPPLDPFIAYRLPGALLLALLVTTMYVWMAALFDRTTGLFAAFAVMLMPNLFGQAHLAMTDAPLAVMWFLTGYCFWKGLQDRRWSLALGVAWGLALATKFPAVAIPAPLLLWAAVYHRRACRNNVLAMALLGPAVMVACQPYLWHQTFARLTQFIHESVSRGARPDTNFAIFFDNQMYFSNTVPWYYSLFMTGVTLPETVLVLALLGTVALFLLKPQREVPVLFFLNAAVILGMGLAPGAVLHDVNRLMLPALPFLAGLAGWGFFVTARHLAEQGAQFKVFQDVQHLRTKLVGCFLVLVLFPAALGLVAYHPYELSYYNRLVGGIEGAFLRGLEVTYLMEAFTPEFLAMLNRELPPNAAVNASFSNFMLKYYQKEQRLRPDIRITGGRDYDYYLLLNRRSGFSRRDRAVMAAGPTFAAWEFDGVPLVLMTEKKRP